MCTASSFNCALIPLILNMCIFSVPHTKQMFFHYPTTNQTACECVYIYVNRQCCYFFNLLHVCLCNVPRHQTVGKPQRPDCYCCQSAHRHQTRSSRPRWGTYATHKLELLRLSRRHFLLLVISSPTTCFSLKETVNFRPTWSRCCQLVLQAFLLWRWLSFNV